MSGILVVGNIQANTAQAQSFTAISATGGQYSTISVNGTTYGLHVFLADGTFTVTNTGTNATVEYLIVGGGGGGGMDMGGGGGGGGVLTGTYTVSATSYPVVVGAGGWGAPAGGQRRGDLTGPQPTSHPFTVPATAGGNSSVFGLTAVGGGTGGMSRYTDGRAAGGAGGCGGGASGYSDNSGTQSGGAGTSGQGYAGGNGGGQYYSGGGGGAGGPGINSTFRSDGGPGLYSDILGVGYYWGGGGGGAGYSIIGGNGGAGGGGGGAIGTTYGGLGYNNGAAGGGGNTGQQANTPGGNAGNWTGGGGGGGSHYNSNNSGGNGGKGIVVIRYPLGAEQQKISVLNGGAVAVPGSIIQVKYIRVDARNTYTSYTTGDGNPIGELGITITPKSETSMILLRWMINGEIHHGNVFRLFQDGMLITQAGYQGYNNQAGASSWSGVIPCRYDRNNTDSTPANYFIQFMIPAYNLNTRTYQPAVRSAGGSQYTFFLNRTAANLGADNYEVMVSAGYAMEIAQ